MNCSGIPILVTPVLACSLACNLFFLICLEQIRNRSNVESSIGVYRPLQVQLEPEDVRDIGTEVDESLRSLSMDRFSGDGERRVGKMVVGGRGIEASSGEAWRFWNDLYISLHKCADIVYVGDIFSVVLIAWDTVGRASFG
ncbi:hypothetical protein GGR57DRAFT_462522 [Xylariaceae sp. FL1272]|nr:hypothetical protein GGR57DRAFT_462522 [Xylariaceae sp. FL1272]